MESLDLAASSDQKLDLEFADGLRCIAKCVDNGANFTSNTAVQDLSTHNSLIHAMQRTSNKTHEVSQQLFHLLASNEDEWSRPKFESIMKECMRLLSTALPDSTTQSSLDVTSSLCYVRDFVQDANNTTNELPTRDMDSQLQMNMESLELITSQAFDTSVHIYKLLLLRSLATTLSEHWEQLTSVTSGDIDRAAVENKGTPKRDTVHASSIRQLFQSYASSPCHSFVESWWNVIDADKDGCIDQEEMNTVVELAMKPVHLAWKEMVQLSLNACPSRRDGFNDAWFLGGNDMTFHNHMTISKPSWRSRRKEQAAQKLLLQTFSSTLSRHFRDQVETPHRLRCIYAWADKAHQDNKIDSILVDTSEEWGATIVGRKRYVELEPKISYDEFRGVQRKHFPQLDAIGGEIVGSFKEDLWVLQGKGRQNAELRRDCFLFLGVVSLIDLGIGLL